MGAKIPRMDYRQYRAACRLVHECCNYDNGDVYKRQDITTAVIFMCIS